MTDRRTMAVTLRDEFDRSFAARPATERPTYDALLAIQIAGNAYALRVAELAALHVDRVIVRVPSPLPELVGLVALRGVMMPVYDLGALLGYPAARTARWIAVARPTPSLQGVALAFDSYEQHIHVPAETVFTPALPDAHQHVHGVIQVAGRARPIVNVASVLEAIERRAARPREE